MDAPASSPPLGSVHQETLAAVRNAIKLGGSLIATWGIALGIRMLLPRFLGPDLFGPLNFADAFTTGACVVLTLGVDTYIRKEVPVRPEHASDFFGGVVVVRLAASVVLAGVMALVLRLTHRSPEVRTLVYLYAGAQFLIIHNQSQAALLHARGTVDGLAVVNVVCKVLWGAGVLAAAVTHQGLTAFAGALLLSEAIKAVALTPLTLRHLGLTLHWSWRALKGVVWQSLPFFLNTAAFTLYSKADVSILAFMSNDREVGWYGAASNLAGITLLTTPLIQWIILPLFTRAAARSEAEFDQVLRRSLELILALAFPISLVTVVGADHWIHLIFGPAFAPAALPLRALAPTFLLTYVATVSATTLIRLGRPWMMTCISLGGLVVTPVLDYLLIPRASQAFGPAGGGLGCAMAIVVTETCVIIAQMSLIGRRAFDRRSLSMIAKTLAACAVVLVVDHWLGAWGWGRLLIDAALYLALVVSSRALRLGEMYDFAIHAFRSREPST
ncbi:MAG TPA: flippase [Myxococcaceae bacterium]|nr:flippase [Myxococcaceae bacterium]